MNCHQEGHGHVMSKDGVRCQRCGENLKKPKPNPGPPAKHMLTNLEERVYDLEAQVAVLVQGHDKKPVRNTKASDCTGITVTKEELALIINALCYYVKYSNIDMRQEQSEWIYLTINRLDRILKDGWGSL